MTKKDLDAMQSIDVRKIDPAALPDISEIKIDPEQPPEQRVASLLRQTNGNPYFFRSGRLVVKTSFAGEFRLQALLEECLEKL